MEVGHSVAQRLHQSLEGERERGGRKENRKERTSNEIAASNLLLSSSSLFSPHLVSDVLEVGLEVLLCTVQEPLGLHVGGTEGQEVNGCKASLLPRGDKHDDGHLGRVLADGLVDWLHHGNESRWSVRDVVPLNG